MKPIYRNAKLSDEKQITKFQLAMAKETENLSLDPVICSRGVNAVFNNSSLGQYYVCEVNGDVVGSLLITNEWSDWRNGSVWWIQSVYIEPEFRGKKLYSNFYHYIQQIAINNKEVRGLRLYVDKTNTKAQGVYTKLGMNGEHYQVFEWMT